jgi:glycosyltransferase involved in cell wall biosynthesis
MIAPTKSASRTARSAITICVDARSAFGPTRRGIGKCLVELYRNVAAIRPEWRLAMFHRGDGCDTPFAGLANVEDRKIEMPGDRWGLWLGARLPWEAKRIRSSVLHCPANTGPRWPFVPMVLTIHDLIPLQPEFATDAQKWWGPTVAAAARKARQITTPSEYSRQQIAKTFGLSPGRITVHHWGPHPACRPFADDAETARIRQAYGIGRDRRYVFAFGGEDPRKNTERIVRAWHSLPGRLHEQFSLVVIGVQEPLQAKLRQQCRDHGSRDSCVVHGYVSEDDLPRLLGGATLLCFPSLSEGFGLPVLDAFACETPVLTSRVTSIPEVAGDAAHYVDPRSEGEIADGIRWLIEDADARAAFVEKGKRRLALFSWRCCAEKFCEAIEAAL